MKVETKIELYKCDLTLYIDNLDFFLKKVSNKEFSAQNNFVFYFLLRIFPSIA